MSVFEVLNETSCTLSGNFLPVQSTVNVDLESEVAVARRAFNPAWFLLVGFLLAFSEMIGRLLAGKTLVDSIWPHAVRSLEWTMTLRNSPALVLSMMLIIAGVAFGLRKFVAGDDGNRLLKSLLHGCIGVLFGFILIHFLMDAFYLQGAFLLLPTLMGWALACFLVALAGPPSLRAQGQSKASPARVVHVIGVFFAAWLVMPGVPAVIGFAPAPPEAPSMGYGSFPGPYTVEQYRSPYAMPDEVAQVQGALEDDVEFSVYITLPNIPADLPISSMPLAVLLHGFGYPDVNAYQDWINHLASKGMAVAFIQYPSDLRPPGHEAHEATYERGMSDYLQHAQRDLALRAALDHIDAILLQPLREQQLEEHLGERYVDPTSLWTGGHSLGAAYTFITLDDVLERGWGSKALVVALESPASRPMQEHLQPDLSTMPDETMVQIGVPQDDMSVGMCPGAFHQQLFSSLPEERNQLLEIQSDLYGFPRLVASHYLQTDPAHDTLADWSFYRRVDAQADYLVAHGRDDTFTADWAFQYMTDETMLTGMGNWSDGTPVLPMIWHTNAIDEVSTFRECV